MVKVNFWLSVVGRAGPARAGEVGQCPPSGLSGPLARFRAGRVPDGPPPRPGHHGPSQPSRPHWVNGGPLHAPAVGRARHTPHSQAANSGQSSDPGATSRQGVARVPSMTRPTRGWWGPSKQAHGCSDLRDRCPCRCQRRRSGEPTARAAEPFTTRVITASRALIESLNSFRGHSFSLGQLPLISESPQRAGAGI